MLGSNQNKSEIQQTDGILANSLVASISLQGELQIHNVEGKLLNAEDVISKLTASRRLNRELAIVWLPTQKLVMTEAIVPGKRKAHWMAALPYALEEGLSEPVESYHFVPYNRTNAGLVSLAAASHEDMKNWKRIIESAGLGYAQLVPDCFRLQNNNGEVAEGSHVWTLFQQGSTVLVRTSAYQGLAGNSDWYHAIKEQALNQRYMKDLQAVTDIKEVTVKASDLLSSHSQNLPKVLSLSLSQYAYKTRSGNESKWYEWRWVAVLIFIVVGLYLTNQVMQTQQLKDQVDYTQQKNTELFKVMFPEAKRIVNIKSQTLMYLKRQAEGSGEALYLMPILQQVEPWFSQAKTVKVEQLQWHRDKKQKPLELTVTATNTKELENIIELSNAQNNRSVKLSLSLKNVNADGAQGVIYVDAN